MNNWKTKGYEGFSAGTCGNGGQNLYVSRQGILQRIHQTDITGNGFIDLVFCNSQNHEEKVPLELYPDPVNHPDISKKLYLGGASSGCVADLNGDGFDDLAVSCIWDGMTLLTNSAVFYGCEEGLNNKYINYFPTETACCVSAGDFNGDGKQDLVFISSKQNIVKVYYQGSLGFESENMKSFEFEGGVNLATLKKGNGREFDSLLIRKTNGSCFMIPGSEKGLDPSYAIMLLEADEDYQKVDSGGEKYLQRVKEPEPLMQIIEIGNRTLLCAFRKNYSALYPVEGNSLGDPHCFKCKNAISAAAGDIFNSGKTDIVFACREVLGGKEYSWVYPASGDGTWKEENRISLETYKACDVLLHDFSGGASPDIIICQSHTEKKYTHKVTIFVNDGNSSIDDLKTVNIPAHDAYRIFIVNNQLLVNNCRSGSFVGDADVFIYPGDEDGYRKERRISLPAWGCTDMVCCDFNDDGIPDLALANAAELSPWLDPGSFIYYNRHNGFESEPDQKLRTWRAHGVVCADIDKDGFLDLVFCGFDNKRIKIFYGSEDGFLEENSREILMKKNGEEFKNPRFMALADLNGDGWLDLVIPIIDKWTSFVLWGGPDGFSFENSQEFHVRHACNAKVADLNGNGYPDLIFGGHTQSLGKPHDAFVYIYWGSKDGYSESRRSLIPSNAVNSLAVADFNNDGLLDLFIASYQDGKLRDIDSHIYWNMQDEGFLPHERLPLRTHAVSGNMVADFNEDGWIDLAVVNHKVKGNHIAYSTVWYNGPEGFSEENTIDLPSEGAHGMGNVDPGNILDRCPEEYFISSKYVVCKESKIESVSWKADIPAKTWVRAAVRFSENPETVGNARWTDWFDNGQKINLSVPEGSAVQYKLALGATNSLRTPRIIQVIVLFR